jgi:hypothetical protein
VDFAPGELALFIAACQEIEEQEELRMSNAVARVLAQMFEKS